MAANWFIALPFPATGPTGQELERLPTGTRAFDPRDLHVTLAFLGEVGEERALCAWEQFDIGSTLPLSAAVGPRAVFGSPRRPSALGLDLDAGTDDSPLTRFIAEWRDVLRSAAGVAPETRPVRPHLTLGRPPRRTDAAWQQALNAWLAGTAEHASPVTLEQVALYTRAESGQPRRFRAVRTFAPDAIGRRDNDDK